MSDEHGEAHARNSDPETSRDAALSIEGECASKLERKVQKVVENHPAGISGESVADILEMSRVTTSPRFAPLQRKGLIHDSGLRQKSRAGRPSIVWKPGPAPDIDPLVSITSDNALLENKLSAAYTKNRGIKLSVREVQQLVRMLQNKPGTSLNLSQIA